MQKGYLRNREVQDYKIAGVVAAIANGKLTRKDGTNDMFTIEDFLAKKTKEFTELEKDEMLRERQELAQKALDNSRRFDTGVTFEDYGGH